MNERLKKVTTVVKEKWTGFSKAVKIMLISIPVVIVAIIILLVIIANHKDSSVLYSGLSTQEAIEIAAAIDALGVEGTQVSDGTIKVPSDQVDALRMQLAVQGYPKTSTGYEIWNNGINLWTTQGQLREVARQQREANIATTVGKLNKVRSCTVNLDIPETKDYTINPEKKPPTCSVQLLLNGDSELTSGEVRAIYSLVSASVEGLTYDNISITDTDGNKYDYISKEAEEAEGRDASGVPIAKKRYEFQRTMQEAILKDMKAFLETVYGPNGYSINVSARLNYDGKSTESVTYIPSGPDNTGVLHIDKWVNSYTGLNNEGGLVGDTPNADLSPSYPTYIGELDGDRYFYQASDKEYDVSYIKEVVESDGYSIENLSVGVFINASEMSERDLQATERLIADAAGTDTDHVTVVATPFVITNPNPGGSTNRPFINVPTDPYRNMLLMLVIALGVILVILLIASLFVSKSRKKKIRRRQELALAAAQAAAAEGGVAYGNEAPDEVDFNIASLTEEAGKESRETILKREIAEFARTSPDIVASIIHNMLRDE